MMNHQRQTVGHKPILPFPSSPAVTAFVRLLVAHFDFTPPQDRRMMILSIGDIQFCFFGFGCCIFDGHFQSSNFEHPICTNNRFDIARHFLGE
jgi:hypothetical protein